MLTKTNFPKIFIDIIRYALEEEFTKQFIKSLKSISYDLISKNLVISSIVLLGFLHSDSYVIDI